MKTRLIAGALAGTLALLGAISSVKAATGKPNIAAMQERLNALGKESAKPLALIYVTAVGLAHGKPLMASEDGKGPALAEGDGYSITDEGFGEQAR